MKTEPDKTLCPKCGKPLYQHDGTLSSPICPVKRNPALEGSKRWEAK